VLRLSLLLISLAAGVAGAGEPAAATHLLRGAEHFAQARFAQALVEFRVAERRGAGAEATWYAAATLLKLGRAEEAVEAFAQAAVRAPDDGDLVLDYYRAVACFDVRLFHCAGRQLDRVMAEGGPRVAAEARRLKTQVETALSAAASPAEVDALLARGLEAMGAKRPGLGFALLEEAMHHSDRSGTAHRRGEVLLALQRARQALAGSGEPGTAQ
jgi:tetratricopeptide (TPR) repeat protein